MKKRLFIGWLVVLFGTGSPFAGEPVVDISYEDLPRLVREQNGRVKSEERLIQSSRRRTGHLKRSFLPSAHVEGGYESFKTGAYKSDEQPYGEIEARLNVSRGGRDLIEEKIRRTRVETFSADLEKTYADVLYEARELYWELVMNRELVEIFKEALSKNKKIIAAANRRINRGLATDTDRIEFEMVELRYQEEGESAAHEILLIELALAPLIGVPAGTRIETPIVVEHEHADHTDLSWTAEGIPEIRHLTAEKELAVLQGRASKLQGKWTMDLYGGAYLYTLRERDYLDRDLRDDTAVGVKASLPFFDGFQSRADVSSYLMQADALTRRAEYAKMRTEAKLLILKEELKHNDDLVHSTEKQIELGKRYLQYTLDEYDRGVKNSTDVIEAIERRVGLERQLAERKRNHQQTSAELLKVLGR